MAADEDAPVADEDAPQCISSSSSSSSSSTSPPKKKRREDERPRRLHHCIWSCPSASSANGPSASNANGGGDDGDGNHMKKPFRRGQGGFCSARAIQNWRALGSCRSEPAVEAECLGRAASEWQFSFSLPHPHGQAVRQRPIVEGIKAWEDIHLLHGHRRLLLELDSLPGGTLCK